MNGSAPAETPAPERGLVGVRRGKNYAETRREHSMAWKTNEKRCTCRGDAWGRIQRDSALSQLQSRKWNAVATGKGDHISPPTTRELIKITTLLGIWRWSGNKFWTFPKAANCWCWCGGWYAWLNSGYISTVHTSYKKWHLPRRLLWLIHAGRSLSFLIRRFR